MARPKTRAKAAREEQMEMIEIFGIEIAWISVAGTGMPQPGTARRRFHGRSRDDRR